VLKNLCGRFKGEIAVASFLGSILLVALVFASSVAKDADAQTGSLPRGILFRVVLG